MGEGDRFEVFEDKKGEGRFTFVSANEEPGAQSEGYSRGVEAAERGARDLAAGIARSAGMRETVVEQIRENVKVVRRDDEPS